MVKIAKACPFSNKACTECAVYRGRHRNLSFSRQCGPLGNGQTEYDTSDIPPLSVEFKNLRDLAEPSSGGPHATASELKVRLKVIDMESGEARVCDIDDSKEWNWDDPFTWRMLDGRQITSLDRLFTMVRSKAEMGFEEVELYEAPRFMLLAGG